MEPVEAINLLEVVLRDLVRSVMGDSWQTEVDLAALEIKHAQETAKRRGARVSDNLLDYTEFTQLQDLISKHWDKFAPALGKKKYVDVYFDRVGGFRNPAMHSRSLLPFERDLVNGIVGEFRNLAALYRSTQGPDMVYYPVIDSVTDSFGNTNEPGLKETKTGIRLNVGSVVTFECRGSDPQGRELHWESEPVRPFTGGEDSAIGDDVRLTWTVVEENVGEDIKVSIELSSSGQYHRRGTYDDFYFFTYSVDPPS